MPHVEQRRRGRSLRFSGLAAIGGLLLMSSPLASRKVVAQEPARAAAPFRYVLRIAEPHTHYLDVDATFSELNDSSAEFFMAVWTPGS